MATSFHVEGCFHPRSESTFGPDQPIPACFTLQDALHAFKKGGRLISQVRSGGFLKWTLTRNDSVNPTASDADLWASNAPTFLRPALPPPCGRSTDLAAGPKDTFFGTTKSPDSASKWPPWP